jgi:hypothetical protein
MYESLNVRRGDDEKMNVVDDLISKHETLPLQEDRSAGA